ncbi:MAG: hypothetical protein FWG98_06900 [Candidatus Cloacimonetes bacterium]|nr:hypothetical protein [Candidatus Cloacimonadota bacterium]
MSDSKEYYGKPFPYKTTCEANKQYDKCMHFKDSGRMGLYVDEVTGKHIPYKRCEYYYDVHGYEGVYACLYKQEEAK